MDTFHSLSWNSHSSNDPLSVGIDNSSRPMKAINMFFSLQIEEEHLRVWKWSSQLSSPTTKFRKTWKRCRSQKNGNEIFRLVNKSELEKGFILAFLLTFLRSLHPARLDWGHALTRELAFVAPALPKSLLPPYLFGSKTSSFSDEGHWEIENSL